MLLLFNNSQKTGLSCIWKKKCLTCQKLNHFALVCRSKFKINEIYDTNSNNESDIDTNELYIDHVGSSVNTKDDEIILDALVNDVNITFNLDTEAQCSNSHCNIQ